MQIETPNNDIEKQRGIKMDGNREAGIQRSSGCD